MHWHKKIAFSVILAMGLLLCLFLAGCIQQEVVININSDGSGEYTIIKYPGEFEEIVIAAVDGESMLDMSAEKLAEEIKSRSDGPVKCIGYDIVKNHNGKGKAEITKYSFDDLGKAVVILENIIKMGPRFKYDDGRFVVFVNREKNEYDGVSGGGPEERFYYKLTVNLPGKPSCDSKGKIEGNSVSWEFDNEAMKAYRESMIGENLLRASVDAGAVKTDLSPKLFVKKEKSSRHKQEISFLQDFFCYIDLLKESEPLNGRFTGYVPTDDIALPFSYDNLKITRFVIDGTEKEFKLKSRKAGIFSGKDRWSRDVPGLPVNLTFSETNPWVKNIDLLEIELEISKPVKTVFHEMKINDIKKMSPVAKFGGSIPTSAAIVKVELGSNTAAYPLPFIEVVTDIEPADIMACYLDTDFGIRYKSMGPSWNEVKLKDSWNEKLKKLGEHFTSGKQIRKGNLVFTNIPPDSFTLVFEVITEKSAATETLKLEDVYVGQK